MITTTVGASDDWSAVDSERLAVFLSSETGRRFLMALANFIPPLLEGGHVNKVLIRSGEVRGQTALIQHFQYLAHPPAPPVSPSDNYPPLDLDAAWEVPTDAEPKSAPKE